MHVVHPIAPVYDAHSRLLILGSFPSVKSREMAFFYGHPQNRFWKVLAILFDDAIPMDVPARRAFLLRHQIAVWDVIASCDIEGSSDSSIRNAKPNDLREILDVAPIEAIFVNGQTAAKYYRKYTQPIVGIESTVLPSSSPANAAWGLERLASAWGELLMPYRT